MVGEKSIKIDGKNFKFQWLKGKVLEVKSLARTVGGGEIWVSPNQTTSSNIQIGSVEQLDLFLEDASGAEHAFKLEDFNFSCRTGHKITIIKLLVNNAKRGPFIGLYNHTTREHRVKYGLMQIMTRPSRTPSCLMALMAPFVLGLILYFLLGIIFNGEAPREVVLPLTFGASFAIWIVLLVLYQNKKNRKYGKLKNAYDSLPI